MNMYSSKRIQIYENHSTLYLTPKTNKHNLLIKNVSDSGIEMSFYKCND